MLPLGKPTGNYSVAMVLNLGCLMAFRGVRDMPEFNFTVKLKQMFNFPSFTEVYIFDLKKLTHSDPRFIRTRQGT
jgi:hypothetical protein